MYVYNNIHKCYIRITFIFDAQHQLFKHAIRFKNIFVSEPLQST